MLDVALKILKELTDHSYKAYIVGGFVRDQLLGIESNDIDITTNATPKEIKEILRLNNIKEDDECLIIGLGNNKSTADALGPKTIENIENTSVTNNGLSE